MYGKRVKLRILFLSLTFILLILATILILKSLEEEVVYFISPTEIQNLSEINKEKIRVGGMVKKGSIIIKSKEINFVITDYKNDIQVSFSGAVPNLFSEGKGVVAEGFLKDKNFFISEKILAKHDENYMPPEVKKALESK